MKTGLHPLLLTALLSAGCGTPDATQKAPDAPLATPSAMALSATPACAPWVRRRHAGLGHRRGGAVRAPAPDGTQTCQSAGDRADSGGRVRAILPVCAGDGGAWMLRRLRIRARGRARRPEPIRATSWRSRMPSRAFSRRLAVRSAHPGNLWGPPTRFHAAHAASAAARTSFALSRTLEAFSAGATALRSTPPRIDSAPQRARVRRSHWRFRASDPASSMSPRERRTCARSRTRAVCCAGGAASGSTTPGCGPCPRHRPRSRAWVPLRSAGIALRRWLQLCASKPMGAGPVLGEQRGRRAGQRNHRRERRAGARGASFSGRRTLGRSIDPPVRPFEGRHSLLLGLNDVCQGVAVSR